MDSSAAGGSTNILDALQVALQSLALPAFMYQLILRLGKLVCNLQTAARQRVSACSSAHRRAWLDPAGKGVGKKGHGGARLRGDRARGGAYAGAAERGAGARTSCVMRTRPVKAACRLTSPRPCISNANCHAPSLQHS